MTEEEKLHQFFVLIKYLNMDLLSVKNMTDAEREFLVNYLKKEIQK